MVDRRIEGLIEYCNSTLPPVFYEWSYGLDDNSCSVDFDSGEEHPPRVPVVFFPTIIILKKVMNAEI